MVTFAFGRAVRLGVVLRSAPGILVLCAACNGLLGNDPGTLAASGAKGGSAGDDTTGGKGGRGGTGATGGSDSGAGGEGDSSTGGSTGGKGGKGGRGGSDAGGSAGRGGSSATGGTGADAGMGGSGDCTEGERRCASGQPEECTDGAFQAATPCDDDHPFCFEGGCFACPPGTHRCSGSELQECTMAGEWSTLETCSGTTPVCNADAGICSDLRLLGGFARLGPRSGSATSMILSDGAFHLHPRSCDSGTTLCVRGGFLP